MIKPKQMIVNVKKGSIVSDTPAWDMGVWLNMNKLGCVADDIFHSINAM